MLCNDLIWAIIITQASFDVCYYYSLLSFIPDNSFVFVLVLEERKKSSNGEAELEAVCGELLHNERKREAKEGSWAFESRESTAFVSAQTETLQTQEES